MGWHVEIDYNAFLAQDRAEAQTVAAELAEVVDRCGSSIAVGDGRPGLIASVRVVYREEG
jgi:hypothetical protein